MKKYLLIILSIFMLTGCSDLMNTPTKRVEEFLGKYQTMDTKVIDELEETINSDTSLNDEAKKEYKKALKRQYQNLSYKIKDETYNGNNATVEVEIEVYNYKKSNDNSDSYVLEHKDEFLNSDGTLDNEKVNLYKMKQMHETKDKIKYTIELGCTKEKSKWTLDNITEATRTKIHGLY